MLSAQNPEISRLYAAKSKILNILPKSKKLEKYIELENHIDPAISWWCNIIKNKYDELNFGKYGEKPVTSKQFEIFTKDLKKGIIKYFDNNSEPLILNSMNQKNLLLVSASKADISFYLIPRDMQMQLTPQNILITNKNDNISQILTR